MQDARSNNAVNNRYNVNTTDPAIINAHESARAEYETYVSLMFAARLAAQQAYDALTPAQQAQIDPALVAKLSDDLPTEFRYGVTYGITPSDDVYMFETVNDDVSGGMCYEVSNNITNGPEIPAIFVLVDASTGAQTWSPSGLYVQGESNYELAYCCDVSTALAYGTHYKRVNLEDAGYYGTYAAQHIRAILQYSYPFVSLDEMKANLVAAGLDSSFVSQVTRADAIAAVQMAVWAYANSTDEEIAGNTEYGSTYDVANSATAYMNPMHDYTNELWTWWTTARKQTSYDARAEYRVNTLAYYLCTLPGVAATSGQIIISEVEVTRADLMADLEETYSVGMYVHLNAAGAAQDDLAVTVTSYHTNEDGSIAVTGRNRQAVGERSVIEMYVAARPGDTIEVVVDGTQYVERGVYFYEPEGGRDASQCLVGVGEGKTKVDARVSFDFSDNPGEMGLRVYKTAAGTGSPLSEIAFSIYEVVLEEGEQLGATPTEEEIARFVTGENLLCTIVTDATGYAEAVLPKGTYLVVEEHNAEKVVAPVSPFYLSIPMQREVEGAEGTTIELVDIVSVYPKNEPYLPPEPPPIVPPTPPTVEGSFSIYKYDAADSSVPLAGAEFAVYRSATDSDTNTITVICDGKECAVAPYLYGGAQLVLTTGADGYAASPSMPCGTYFLLETKAPAGYNLMSEAVSVTVVPSEVGATALAQIPNTHGTVLPSTGGSGTGWIYLLGGALVLVAGVSLARGFKKAGARD